MLAQWNVYPVECEAYFIGATFCPSSPFYPVKLTKSQRSWFHRGDPPLFPLFSFLFPISSFLFPLSSLLFPISDFWQLTSDVLSFLPAQKRWARGSSSQTRNSSFPDKKYRVPRVVQSTWSCAIRSTVPIGYWNVFTQNSLGLKWVSTGSLFRNL